MADSGFNGSTAALGATNIIPLVTIDYTDAPTPVDVGGAADTTVKHQVGRHRKTTTVTHKGGPLLAKGQTGVLAIVWNDTGTAGSMTKAIVAKKPVSGKLDGEITTTYTFRPTPA
jgi:hypothetical protein